MRFWKIYQLLFIIINLVIINAVAYAQTLIISDISGNVGDVIVVPVDFSNDADNVVSLQCDIKFNPELAKIEKVSAGPALSDTGFSLNYSFPSNGIVRVVITPPIQTILPPIPSGEIIDLIITIIGSSKVVNFMLDNVVMSDANGNGVQPIISNNSSADITATGENPVSNTTTDYKNITLTLTVKGDGSIFSDSVKILEPEGNLPSSVSFPFGIISFVAGVPNPGDSITIAMKFSTQLPENIKLYKVNNNNYTQMPVNLWQKSNDNTIELILTDGGQFDLDGVQNARIVDPIGIGSAEDNKNETEIEDTGGCAMSPNSKFDPVLLILIVSLIILYAYQKKI